MRLRVQFDSSALKARTDREVRRLAFNTALALNETGKAIQTAERVNLDRRFTLRKAGFMYRLIKITAFASARQALPYIEIAIDPTKKNVLLGKLEKGGIKQPEVGRSVAVPITGGPARPSFGKQVEPTLQIGRLRFKQRTTSTGKVQWVGGKRTFIIPGVGIFQRGSGIKTSRRGKNRFKGLRERTGVRLLYAFRKSPKLKASLHFIDTALATFKREWPIQFAKSFLKP